MKIISIDDNKTNLLIIESYAKTLSLQIDSFLEPKEALVASSNVEYDLVIVDYMMPEMNGLEFIQEFRKTNPEIPIIMLTAVGDDMQLQIKALEYGANDFLSKPINAPAFKARIVNMLKLRKSQLLLKNKAMLLQEEVDKATLRLKESELETLQMLGKTAEYKDPETNAHTQRVSHYCKILARAYGLDENLQDIIFYASPFHDLGKIGIPDRILLKPGKLDADEYEIMKKHSQIGHHLLKANNRKKLHRAADLALLHHERYDGSGYPAGLAGEEISYAGRLIAVADVFDALGNRRPYRAPWALPDIIAYMKDQSGKHFDPQIVKILLEHIDEVVSVRTAFPD